MHISGSDISNLITAKLSEGQTLAALYVTAFTVYMTISGALLKFTIDAINNGDAKIKQLLTLVGCVTSAVYLAACIFQWIAGQQLSADIEHLNTQIGNPLGARQVLFLLFISITSGAFTIFALIGWFLLRRVRLRGHVFGAASATAPAVPAGPAAVRSHHAKLGTHPSSRRFVFLQRRKLSARPMLRNQRLPATGGPTPLPYPHAHGKRGKRGHGARRK